MRTAAQSLIYLLREIADRLEARRQRTAVVPREEKMLRHLVRGRRNKEIAQAQEFSVDTITLHVSNVLEKLGAVDRTRTAKLAINWGIVRLE